MQRMQLHLRGLKLPKLGSLQDRMMRTYLQHEQQLDGQKTKLLALVALTNPAIQNEGGSRKWNETVSSTWKNYTKLLYNLTVTEEEEKTSNMMDFYMNVVRHTKLSVVQGEGGLQITGLKFMEKHL